MPETTLAKRGRLTSQKRRKTWQQVILSIIAVIVMIIVLFPIVWMLPAAFKGKTEIFATPAHWWPWNFTGDNFVKVFTPASYDKWNFTASFFSTLAVASTAVVLSLFFNMMTAYVFARLEFRGKKFLWVYFIFSMFVPGITILFTSYRVVAWLGMLDTFWVLVLPGVVTSYNILFFRQFFLSLPEALEEAAEIDGLTPFGIFIRIFIPMAITPMIVIGFSVFMGYWNSFVWPTLTITDNVGMMQMMQVIRTLSARYDNEYGVVIAASLISLLGPLVVFAFAQKQIVQGVAITGLK
jgi:multiple sugar transport system permease protein